tara:strand:+ start:2358 stop:2606 length:249 start_codon:yes stop_codon:yes gene_type:complete
MEVNKMSWKNILRKNIFGKDPDEMTRFMNVTPRLEEEAKKRQAKRLKEEEEVEKLIPPTTVVANTMRAAGAARAAVLDGDDE